METTDDDSQRWSEIEILQSMFISGEELKFPDVEDLYYFVLQLSLDANDGSDPALCELSCSLPPGYPAIPADYSITCERIRRSQNDRLKTDLLNMLQELGEGEMQVLAAIEWLKDNASRYFAQETAASCSGYERQVTPTQREPKGFMREWCSFVSLYLSIAQVGSVTWRNSKSLLLYSPPPQVMTSLARGRGLNITGMGIAGKPGGMVAEGEEGDVVEFMELMRTEFFETLNPRGRKLTTRLQERWPLDDEQERYEAAQVMQKLKNDAYRAAEREAGVIKKQGEKERLEKQELEDRALLKAWEQKTKRTLEDAEVEALLEAGPPSKCKTPGIYKQCGCEEPPTPQEIERQRLFQDFTIFTGKAGFEASYQEAAKIFKELGRMDGFDAMFTYRFS